MKQNVQSACRGKTGQSCSKVTTQLYQTNQTLYLGRTHTHLCFAAAVYLSRTNMHWATLTLTLFERGGWRQLCDQLIMCDSNNPVKIYPQCLRNGLSSYMLVSFPRCCLLVYASVY